MEAAVQVLPAENAFDYAALDAETRIVVQQRTSEIRTIVRRAATDVIEIGQKLIEVKARLGHGQFGPWLEAEFAWRERTAQSFMAVAERFKTANIADLNFAPTALYMLAQSSVPDEARATAIQRAETGERITIAAAQTIIAEHMSDAAELKPPVLWWARGIDAANPRSILQQMVITGSPVALSHFEQLGDALRAGGYRFMRSELLTAIRALIEELARPAPAAPRAVEYTPEPADRAAAAPATRAQCHICGRPLSNPASIARGAGDTCSGKHAAHGAGGAAPTITYIAAPGHPIGITEIRVPDPAGDSLAELVLDWLAEKVEALELAEDSQRYCLEQIVKSRAGQTSVGGADAWRELRVLKTWPPAADDDAKLRAVKAALAHLKGETAPEEKNGAQPDADAHLAAADRARRPLNITGATYRTLLDRKHDHVERFLAAGRVLRAWAQAHGELIEDDEQLRHGFELLEDAYTQAMCLD